MVGFRFPTTRHNTQNNNKHAAMTAISLTAAMDVDNDVAYQLLGWSSADGNAVSNADGATIRRAMEILSSEEGRLIFHHDDGCGGCNKEPLLVVKGYFRLIKLASSPLSDDEWFRMASNLLKKLGERCVGAIRDQLLLVSSSSEKAQAQSSTPFPPVAVVVGANGGSTAVLYYFQTVLQDVHPSIKRQIKLLGPAYRCFCDVADSFLSLLEAEKSRMDRFVGTFLPSVGWEALAGLQNDVHELSKVWKECNRLFQRAAFHLLEFADEALDNVQGAMRGQESSISPEKQSKVIVFLFARVTSLVLMTMRFHNSFKSQDMVGEGNDDKEGEKKLISGFLQRLVKVCSLALVAQTKMQEDSDFALLEMVVGLRTKAEHYLAKILGGLDAKDASHMNLVLECFVELPSNQESYDAQVNCLAKLILMKYLLKKLLTAESTACLPQTSTLVKFYENLLFVDIPKCHQFFFTSPSAYNLQSQAMETLTDLVSVLEHVSHLLCHVEKIGGHPDCDNYQQTMIQHHQLLIRWLAPTSADRNASTPNHPISNELLLHALERRVLSSCAAPADDHYSQLDATHLISLLCQLLFHQCTEASHRRNIATLLIRLLSPSSTIKTSKKRNDAKSLTVDMLWNNLMKSNVINSTPHKQKRSQPVTPKTLLLPPDDLYTICRVLEALARWSISSGRSTEVKDLLRGLFDKSGSNSKTISRPEWRLSLAIGAMRASPNMASFLTLFDNGENLSPHSFIEGRILPFLELHLRAKRSSSNDPMRPVIIQSACIQFIGALSECLGRELSETHVNRLGSLLRRVSASANSSSIHAIGLQYDVV